MGISATTPMCGILLLRPRQLPSNFTPISSGGLPQLGLVFMLLPGMISPIEITMVWKIVGSLAAIGLLVISALSFWSHYQGLKTERNALENKLSEERTSHETTKATLTNLQDEYAREQVRHELSLEELRTAYQKERGKVHELEEILADHDLAWLARKKPSLISNRINAGTQRLFLELQRQSGNPD